MSLDATTLTALIATLCAATAPLMQPMLPYTSTAAGSGTGTLVALGCRVLQPRGEDQGSLIALRRPDGRPLPPGARIAWASVGSPAPVGEMRSLDGASEGTGHEHVIASLLRVHGAGCTATARLD